MVASHMHDECEPASTRNQSNNYVEYWQLPGLRTIFHREAKIERRQDMVSRVKQHAYRGKSSRGGEALCVWAGSKEGREGK